MKNIDKNNRERLFVFDLDGTLLRDGLISDRDIKRMNRIQENGEFVAIATGRNAYEAAPVIEKLKIKEFCGAAIIGDGQYVSDYSDDSFFTGAFLTVDDVETIYELTKKECSQFRVITKQQDYIVFKSVFSHEYYLYKRSKEIAAPLFINRKVNLNCVEKIVLWGKLPSLDALNAFEVVFLHDKLRYEIKKKSVTKANAIRWLQSKHAIPDDQVYVFGNDENDVSMFEMYKNSFCISDASENVKSKATYVIENAVDETEIILNK